METPGKGSCATGEKNSKPTEEKEFTVKPRKALAKEKEDRKQQQAATLKGTNVMAKNMAKDVTFPSQELVKDLLSLHPTPKQLKSLPSRALSFTKTNTVPSIHCVTSPTISNHQIHSPSSSTISELTNSTHPIGKQLSIPSQPSIGVDHCTSLMQSDDLMQSQVLKNCGPNLIHLHESVSYKNEQEASQTSMDFMKRTDTLDNGIDTSEVLCTQNSCKEQKRDMERKIHFLENSLMDAFLEKLANKGMTFQHIINLLRLNVQFY
jgi:hypothetical protein